MSHRNLRHLDPKEARAEIVDSKKALEDLFGRSIRHFSFPYGAYNARVVELVAEAGFETACTMDVGVNTPSTPRHRLKRLLPLSSSELALKILHRLRRKACLWQ